jgi:two-component system catabolic regulation response regulator CreB
MPLAPRLWLARLYEGKIEVKNRGDAEHGVQAELPLMFLTSRTTEMDEVRGLELGADGYLKKPISPTTVSAHVKAGAILRRSATAAAPAAKSGVKTAREDAEEADFEIKDQLHPDFRIDEKAEVIYYNRIRLELTASQYASCPIWCSSPGGSFSRI